MANPIIPAQLQGQQQAPQGWWDWLKTTLGGTQGGNQQFPTITQDQQQGLQQILQMLIPQLQEQFGQGSSQGKPFDFAPIRQAAEDRFKQQELPALAHQFNQLGGFGSSGFVNTAANAQRNFSNQLAGEEAKYGIIQGEQRNDFLKNLLSTVFGTKQFENTYVGGTPGLFQTAAEGVGRAAFNPGIGGSPTVSPNRGNSVGAVAAKQAAKSIFS